MKSTPILFCLASCFVGLVHGQPRPPLLDQNDVWLLVMNTPDMIAAEARKACPEIEFTPLAQDRMQAFVTNQCPQKLPASGTMGLFTVDLRDGRIWFDLDETKIIDSERLQRLRKALLSREQLRARSSPRK